MAVKPDRPLASQTDSAGLTRQSHISPHFGLIVLKPGQVFGQGFFLFKIGQGVQGHFLGHGRPGAVPGARDMI